MQIRKFCACGLKDVIVLPYKKRTSRFAAFLMALIVLAASSVNIFASTEDAGEEDGTGSSSSKQQEIIQQKPEIETDQEEETQPESEEPEGDIDQDVQQENQDPLVQLINSAELNPADPQSKALDALLDEILLEIIDEDMDTYEKVKTCYDYLVAHVQYGSHMSRLGTVVKDGVTCGDIYAAYGAVEGYGAVALTANTGMCNAYASAFILMTRKIGLDASLVKGYTRGAGGGYVVHQWAEIEIDGMTYIFDPQLEQDLVKAGLPRYSVFFKTYSQVSGRYSK